MISESVRQQCLVDELQLGQGLNHALQQGHRAEFSLLLSLLSPDVQDQAWVRDPPQPEISSVDWRRRFTLPPAKPLEADAASQERAVVLAEQLAAGGIAAVRLQEYMQPEPLSLKQYLIPEPVWNNLPPLVQAKYQRHKAGEELIRSEPSAASAAMLDSIADAEHYPELKVRYFHAA